MLWHRALRIGGRLKRGVILALPPAVQHRAMPIRAEEAAEELAHDGYRAGSSSTNAGSDGACVIRRPTRTPGSAMIACVSCLGRTMLHLRSS